MSYILPDLPYAYDALEPYFDEKTMHIHHDRHHATYLNNLNAALENYPELMEKSAPDLLKNLAKLPKEISEAVKNNGGGHVNHSFFWEILAPNKGGFPNFEIGDALAKVFGSFETFKEKFQKAAVTRFGSGWAWLVIGQNGLKITSTANQDSPLSVGQVPILCLDVWEHAYYLKYYNARPDYVAAFWNLINWEKVNEFYVKATK